MQQGTSTQATSSIAQKLTELRAKRRKEASTEETIDLGLNGPAFERKFRDVLGDMVGERDSSLECYKVAVNSLQRSFSRRRRTRSMGPDSDTDVAKVESDEADSDGDERVVSKFLAENIETTCAELADQLDGEAPRKQVMVRELRCLFELHLLRVYPRPLSETKVARNVCQLYLTSTPVRTKQFLDDVVCDEFIEDLPFFLAQLYDELEMPMPEDLQPFRAHEKGRKPGLPLQPPGNKLAAKLEELFSQGRKKVAPKTAGTRLLRPKLEPKLEPKVELEEIERTKVTRRRPLQLLQDGEAARAAQRRGVKVEPQQSRLPSDEFKPAVRQLKVTRQTVTQTPDAKLCKRESTAETSDGEAGEVVKQTPIRKIKRAGPGAQGASKHSRLLTQEELQAKQRPTMSAIKRKASTKPDLPAKKRAYVGRRKLEL